MNHEGVQANSCLDNVRLVDVNPVCVRQCSESLIFELCLCLYSLRNRGELSSEYFFEEVSVTTGRF